MERDGIWQNVQAEMLYPKLWAGKSDWPGKLPQGTGAGERGVNRDRRHDRWAAEKAVYSEAERISEVCRSSARDHFEEFNSAEDTCNPGTAWEHIILKKRKASCMIEKTNRKSYPLWSSLFHFNWQFVYFIYPQIFLEHCRLICYIVNRKGKPQAAYPKSNWLLLTNSRHYWQ